MPSARTRAAACVALLTAVSLIACGPSAPPPAPFAVLVTNARIVDGTGTPARDGAVAVSSGRIVAVLDAAAATAAAPRASRVIDARGRVVAPGFIDLHSHSDMPLSPTATPRARSVRA